MLPRAMELSAERQGPFHWAIAHSFWPLEDVMCICRLNSSMDLKCWVTRHLAALHVISSDTEVDLDQSDVRFW